MKTTMMILAAIFSLQVSTLFAGNEHLSVAPVNEITTLNISALSPVTPSVATFEEVNMRVIDPMTFAPMAPAEAEFEEIPADLNITPAFAPVTPSVADFE